MTDLLLRSEGVAKRRMGGLSSRAARRLWTPWRRGVQVAVVVFYTVLPILHLLDIRAVTGTLASLRIGPVDLTEPASALGAALASRTVTTTLLIGVAPLVALAIIAGPVFCSWACPWGFISEGVDKLRHRKRSWDERSWAISGWPRAVLLLAVLLTSAFLSLPLIALLSAPRAITSLPLEVIYLRLLSPLTAIVLLALLVIELLAPRRIWCRVLCPVGSFAALLRTRRTLRPAWDASTCACPRVAVCHQVCPWGIDPRAERALSACTNCMACVDACPHGSLHLSRAPVA